MVGEKISPSFGTKMRELRCPGFPSFPLNTEQRETKRILGKRRLLLNTQRLGPEQSNNNKK